MRVRNKAKGTTPAQQVFSNGFAWFCKGKNVEPVSVLSTSCEVWLNRFFGVGSERGHTTLHPIRPRRATSSTGTSTPW